MTLDRATVVAALRAEDVVTHFAIPGQWRGRWMRSRRCAAADHETDAFGISREGRFHCHACDTGGDLLRLIAIGHKLDLQHDFPAVLAIAAEIAGVEDDDSFGGSGAASKPVPRAPLPPVPPLAERVALAKRRAAWVWDRLCRWDHVGHTVPWGDPGRHCPSDIYLAKVRGLDPRKVRELEELRETPLAVTPQEAMKSEDMKSLSYTFAIPGLAIPVRAVDDGRLVDVRIRRFEPREGQPKIVGMLGGVTVGGADRGSVRQLVGCYGHPEHIDPGDAGVVAVCEGALDYLTALQIWPDGQAVAAVDAGSMSLVAGHVATKLAAFPGARMVIVEQNDPAKLQKDGTLRLGRGDASVNEDVNAAAKRAISILGPKRVGWLFCEDDGGGHIKDLNDLHAARGENIVRNCVRWWVDLP